VKNPFSVTAGLVPAIHVFLRSAVVGHDESYTAQSFDGSFAAAQDIGNGIVFAASETAARTAQDKG
jgi:hypothetical protein